MIQPARASGSGAELKRTTTNLASPQNGEAKAEAKEVIDAGLRSLDHYKRALPRWRYSLRQKMLPIVRWETPYLAYFQSKLRSPALDSYFAVTANLGTHTFFMIGLPTLFWFNYVPLGKGLVHMLASGVFFTGFIKDMCSLPRPLSPPLQRITMSGSAALEYGFPSTHSANAVSVAVYAVLALHDDASDSMSPTTRLLLEALAYFYALSIIVGRLYCGMHGFTDVIVGSAMGAAISLVEFYGGGALEAWMFASSWAAALVVVLVILVLVRVHPEPADDCPCFDDSVAFAGVVIGVELGTWRYARSAWAWPAAVAFGPSAIGWPAAVARLVIGVVVIFAWREVMKPTLLKTLPYLFRAIEAAGLSLPRRFFMRASEYGRIPGVLKLRTDSVIPGVSDLPGMVRNMRRVGRGRSVSIGPQSAADAYETLAYRERRRRESIESQGAMHSKGSLYDLEEKARLDGVVPPGSVLPAAPLAAGTNDRDGTCSQASGVQTQPGATSSIAEYESMMGQGRVVVSPAPAGGVATPAALEGEPDILVGQADELNEREMFSKLIKPRVRYDVEVITKLIVYTGIAWLAVDFIPIMLEVVGLSPSR